LIDVVTENILQSSLTLNKENLGRTRDLVTARAPFEDITTGSNYQKKI